MSNVLLFPMESFHYKTTTFSALISSDKTIRLVAVNKTLKPASENSHTFRVKRNRGDKELLFIDLCQARPHLACLETCSNTRELFLFGWEVQLSRASPGDWGYWCISEFGLPRLSCHWKLQQWNAKILLDAWALRLCEEGYGENSWVLCDKMRTPTFPTHLQPHGDVPCLVLTPAFIWEASGLMQGRLQGARKGEGLEGRAVTMEETSPEQWHRKEQASQDTKVSIQKITSRLKQEAHFPPQSVRKSRLLTT